MNKYILPALLAIVLFSFSCKKEKDDWWCYNCSFTEQDGSNPQTTGDICLVDSVSSANMLQAAIEGYEAANLLYNCSEFRSPAPD